MKQKTFLTKLLSVVFILVLSASSAEAQSALGGVSSIGAPGEKTNPVNGTPRSRVFIRPGMGLSEVQALWGEPSEKIEYELRRQSVWSYPALRNSPATTLTFTNGTLSSASNDQAFGIGVNKVGSRFLASVQFKDQPAGSLARSPDSGRLVEPRPRPPSFMALSDQKVLSEILNEVPSEPEGSSQAAGAAPNPANPISQPQFVE